MKKTENTKEPHAVLLLTCKDKTGIVAGISQFLYKNNGNIIYADQHTDEETGVFFMRIEWELNGFKIPKDKIVSKLIPFFKKYKIEYNIHFTNKIPRIAIFVSKEDHCLNDLISRKRNNEFKGDIKLIISNHLELKETSDLFGIPFYFFPINKNNRISQEKKELAVLKKEKIDLIVLAKYMRILTDSFVKKYTRRIINIHHSFLPAFIGRRPYRQAYSRGVKIIGATSHYVTVELDEGPIIEQDVVRISHRDSVHDIVRKGRDIEKVALARAVRLHVENKILVCRNKTIIFD
ncbi:MAG: formyltetrahydrofolate deformylase [Candidatus Aureabacteria bacterium]|nr:formyltetrahydrofolate deformylase [Candidatus Auribacterota bacterium]